MNHNWEHQISRQIKECVFFRQAVGPVHVSARDSPGPHHRPQRERSAHSSGAGGRFLFRTRRRPDHLSSELLHVPRTSRPQTIIERAALERDSCLCGFYRIILCIIFFWSRNTEDSHVNITYSFYFTFSRGTFFKAIEKIQYSYHRFHTSMIRF